jgi:hypothetical protein
MRLVLFFLISAFSFQLPAFAEAPPYPVNAGIQAIVNQVSVDSLNETISRLSQFYTRHTYSDTTSDTVGIGAAMRWVQGKAESYGPQRFLCERFPYSQSWGGQTVTRDNFICHVTGSDSLRYFIGGHLDSRAAGGDDVTGFAPGADDNGSSCAAFLELLRILPDSITHNLDVVWFTGEEEGLWGSAALAEQMAADDARVDGMICMDMIGHIVLAGGAVDSSTVRLYADGATSQGGTASSSRNFQRYLRWVGESYVPGFDMRIIPASDRPGRGSDHLSFSAVGYPALRVIEQNEDVAYQHGPSDVVENMSCSYARKVAMVTFGALLTMLEAPPRPAPPVLSWSDPHLLHGVIPADVELPAGGHFYLSVRSWYSSDFDSIADLGAAREFDYSMPDLSQITCFSVSRSNSAGYPSPFSLEAISNLTEAESPSASLPVRIALRAYPNPFNSQAVMEYELPTAMHVRLVIFDISGREVESLTDAIQSAGIRRAVWTPDRAASGIYFARLETGHGILTHKLLYLR